jgi:hypothetical protein
MPKSKRHEKKEEDNRSMRKREKERIKKDDI